METWKSVVGYESLYEVSDHGSVRSSAARRGTEIGRIRKPQLTRQGYHKVVLVKNGTAKGHTIHRLVLNAFVGESKLQCNHKDGKKTNNRLSNLEWITPQGNMLHAFRILGLKPPERRGAKAPNCILTEKEVMAIKRLLGVGWKHDALAALFGVSRSTVSMVANGTNWSHL